MRSANTALSSLVADSPPGWFSAEHQVERELTAQRASLERLRVRARAGEGNSRFLASYDCLMRHVELLLLQVGHRLGTSPHRGMVAVVQTVLPGIDRHALEAIVQERHRCKKEGVSPSGPSVCSLEGILSALAGDE